MVPENSTRQCFFVKKKDLRDRVDDLVLIWKLFHGKIAEISIKSKESAQVLEKLDLWFLVWAFSYFKI